MCHLGSGATLEELKWFQYLSTSNSHFPACFCDLSLGFLLSCLSDFFCLFKTLSLPSYAGPLLSPLPNYCDFLWAFVHFQFCSIPLEICVKSTKFLTHSFISLIPFSAHHAPYRYLVFLSPLMPYQPQNSSFMYIFLILQAPPLHWYLSGFYNSSWFLPLLKCCCAVVYLKSLAFNNAWFIKDVAFRRLRRDIVYCQKSWKSVMWKEERLPLSSQTPQGRTMSEYRFERTFLAELNAGMTGMHRLDHFGRGHCKGHSDDSWGFNESSSSQTL